MEKNFLVRKGPKTFIMEAQGSSTLLQGRKGG